MFAIQITEDTIEKILQHKDHLGLTDADVYALRRYYMSTDKKKWIFVRGFYTHPRGKFLNWTTLPAYALKHYDYDKVKIQTDWDQIVHL